MKLMSPLPRGIVLTSPVAFTNLKGETYLPQLAVAALLNCIHIAFGLLGKDRTLCAYPSTQAFSGCKYITMAILSMETQQFFIPLFPLRGVYSFAQCTLQTK